MPPILRSKDFLTGLVFIAAGLGFAITAQAYQLGTARNMGPGYLPTLLGGLLALIGAGIAIADLFNRSEPVGGFSARGLLFVTLSAVMFGVAVQGLGLFLSITLTCTLVTLASREASLKRGLVIGLVMAALSSLLFVEALGLLIPIWGPWLPF